MANSLTFSVAGENVSFTLSAQADGSQVLYSKSFTTATSGGGSGLFLKVYETGSDVEITDYSTLEQGKLYDVKAVDENGDPVVDVVTWSSSGGAEFVSFNFVVDRRPIYQAGLATQTTSYQNIAANTATFGVNQVNYRKTGAEGSNTDSTTNGRLKWIEDKVLHACDDTYNSNFERFHLTNIGGHTSSNAGNQQPHFTSGAYQSMNMPEAKYFYRVDDRVADSGSLPAAATNSGKVYGTDNDSKLHRSNGTAWEDLGVVQGYNDNYPYYLMDSPFTDTGVPSGTLGDSIDAWAEALTQFRTAATPADLEITSYQGYRPVFNDSTGYVPFDHQAEKVISISRQSSNSAQPSWQGQDNGDPAFCPEPGWDGNDSDVWVPRFASYFDKEIAGIFSLGFDGIGLDTGARVWDNAEGRANGSASSQSADGTGSSGIVDYFNGFGIKPVFEAVGLNTWSGAGGPFPDADARYQAAAYWAYFGSWWSWNNGDDFDEDGSGGKIYYNSGSQTVGDPATGGAAFDPNTSEVHCIFQWPPSGNAGSAGTVANILEEYSFLHLKQCMYDFHQAGIIVSASGSPNDFTANASTTNGGQVFAAEDFYDFVLDLANDNITQRPQFIPSDVLVLNGTDFAANSADEVFASPTMNIGGTDYEDVFAFADSTNYLWPNSNPSETKLRLYYGAGAAQWATDNGKSFTVINGDNTNFDNVSDAGAFLGTLSLEVSPDGVTWEPGPSVGTPTDNYVNCNGNIRSTTGFSGTYTGPLWVRVTRS